MAINPSMQSYAARLHTFQIPHHLHKRRASSSTGSQDQPSTTAGNRKKGTTISWPHNTPTPEDLARAGFFYRPFTESPDNVQCFLCAVKLDGWESSDNALHEHLAHSSACVWAQCLVAGNAGEEWMVGTAGNGSVEGMRDPLGEELREARRGTFLAGAAAAAVAQDSTGTTSATSAAGDAWLSWPHESKRGWKCKIAKMVDAGWCFDPAPPATSGSDVGSKDAEDDGDGVTCFYCRLSLDGWEPKDDPAVEHQRRAPDCAFFALAEAFRSTREADDIPASSKSGTVRGKRQSTRTSTAGKSATTARLSTQSAVSEAHDLLDEAIDPEIEIRGEDSLLSTTSQISASAAGTNKPKKKTGRPKATTKSAKTRPRAGTVDLETKPPELDEDARDIVDTKAAVDEEAMQPSTKKARKGTRLSKQSQQVVQPLDSSVVEIAAPESSTAGSKKTTRARQAKAKSQAEPEPEVEADKDDSNVSAQLQEELERSMEWEAAEAQAEEEEATPQPPPPQIPAPAQQTAKGKRGVKRTSDGIAKQSQEANQTTAAAAALEPVPDLGPPVKAASTTSKSSKRGRKPIKAPIPVEGEFNTQLGSQIAPLVSESETEASGRPSKAKKTAVPTAGKKGGKGRKGSSTRSSKVSFVSQDVAADTRGEGHGEREGEEDLERDEREIEAELARIAAEEQQRIHLQQHQLGSRSQALVVQHEHDRLAEFEISPSAKRHVDEIRVLEEELRHEVQGLQGVEGRGLELLVNSVAAVPTSSATSAAIKDAKAAKLGAKAKQLLAPNSTSVLEDRVVEADLTPSPAGSDKENQPSSAVPSVSASKLHLASKAMANAPLLSPTKTTRIPLAPGTPNAGNVNNSLSPSKTLKHLTSSLSWDPVDLETFFLASPPQQSDLALAYDSKGYNPNSLTARLALAASGSANASAGMAGAAGTLTSPERKMTVEQWVRYRAGVGEQVLRRRCEGFVGAFEREGVRGLSVLGGIEVAQ